MLQNIYKRALNKCGFNVQKLFFLYYFRVGGINRMNWLAREKMIIY